MPLTSSLMTYDPKWPNLFECEAARLRPVFAKALIELHHIGSTAVPDLAAKPEIDVLAVVKDMTCLDQWQVDLLALGYTRGRDLMKGHHFFKRDHGRRRTHKLHICEAGHPQVERMLQIRDHLRANPEERKDYAALKFRLERDNKTGIAEYLRGKAPYLDDLYRRIQMR